MCSFRYVPIFLAIFNHFKKNEISYILSLQRWIKFWVSTMTMWETFPATRQRWNTSTAAISPWSLTTTKTFSKTVTSSKTLSRYSISIGIILKSQLIAFFIACAIEVCLFIDRTYHWNCSLYSSLVPSQLVFLLVARTTVIICFIHRSFHRSPSLHWSGVPLQVASRFYNCIRVF